MAIKTNKQTSPFYQSKKITYILFQQMITQNTQQYKANIKAMEITQLSKVYPQQFANFTSNVLQTEDIDHSARYFYTVVKKEASWFGQKIVNLVLKYPFDSDQYPILFFEKAMELNQHLQYVPSQPLKYVLISDVKMVARGTDNLTVVFLVEKKKIEEWNFIFYEKKLIESWEELLKDKKSQFKKIKTQKNQKQNKIKDLLAKISELQQELNTLRVKCQSLFSANQTVENQNRNLHRQNITLIQQNSSLNQTNAKYRRLLSNLENQRILIEERKRRTMPTKTENFFDSQEAFALFQINQNHWKQCLSKIQKICLNIQQTIAKNEENNKLSSFSEQLQLSVKLLKNSVILLGSKDTRKSFSKERVSQT